MNLPTNEPQTLDLVHPFNILKPEWEVLRESVHLDSLIVKYEVQLPYNLKFPSTTHHMIVLQLGHGEQQYTHIGDRKYSGTFTTGDFFLHPAGCEAHYSWTTADEIVGFYIEPNFLFRIARDTECLNPERIELTPIVCDRNSNLEYIARSFLNEMRTEGLGGRLYREALAIQLAIHLLRNYGTFPIKLKQYSSGLSRQKLQTAIDYIQANLEEKVSLEDVAKTTNISPYYFCRLFKQSTGITPYQYLIKCRIEKAKVLLRQEKLSITDIALEVGFSNQSHFTKHFKRIVGTTPKKFIDY